MVWPFTKKESEGNETESRKPSNSKFKQQKLPAWQPILTASTVLPLFFLIGVIFLPLGIGLLVTSNGVKEHIIEYSENDNCKKCENGLEENFKNAKVTNCGCNITFKLDTAWDDDVYFYYGLSNFYQNHRRYVRSRDDTQLHGDLSSSSSSSCAPYNEVPGLTNGSDPIPIAPCGAIANSMFNDKFALKFVENGITKDVPWTHKNIAWKSDREEKFKNPASPLNESFANFAKPKYWTKNVWELDKDDPKNNGFLNQDFIVWMRVAAFPTFRKLYRKLILEKGKFEKGLPKGEYQLRINYNYPVKSFDGKKRFILSTASWIGGKNPFLGIAYIVVGCLCLVFGFVFLVIHMKVRTRPLTH